jgi:hypothetical protein
VPKLRYARTPEDAEEERKIHKLSRSRHAPGDWIFRARIISLNWRGLRTTEIAEEIRKGIVSRFPEPRRIATRRWKRLSR